jgi:UDP-N-acetylmuramate dehydrogenase
LKVGGPARFFAPFGKAADVASLADRAVTLGVPVVPIGSGSNVLVSDEGLNALVIRSSDTRIDLIGSDEQEITIEVGSGVQWEDLVVLATSSGWQGIECMAGIPGLVGAAPIQNIGAYGQELADVFVRLNAYDLHERAPIVMYAEDCDFGYRTSSLKTSAGRYVVCSVVMRLRLNHMPLISYADLEQALQGASTPSLTDTAEAVRAIRRRKGMVVDADDPDSISAGSFFMNPIVSGRHFDELVTAWEARHGIPREEVPHWPAGQGRTKISAAWLIERTGFEKGYRLGNARISGKHALAIVNAGGATSMEILTLCDQIRERVHVCFGTDLEPEVQLLGFDNQSGA